MNIREMSGNLYRRSKVFNAEQSQFAFQKHIKKQSMKEEVPTMNEIQKRTEQCPLTKDELINYLVKLHQTDIRLSKEMFLKLSSLGMDSIVSSVALLRNNKQKCNEIV